VCHVSRACACCLIVEKLGLRPNSSKSRTPSLILPPMSTPDATPFWTPARFWIATLTAKEHPKHSISLIDVTTGLTFRDARFTNILDRPEEAAAHLIQRQNIDARYIISHTLAYNGDVVDFTAGGDLANLPTLCQFLCDAKERCDEAHVVRGQLLSQNALQPSLRIAQSSSPRQALAGTAGEALAGNGRAN
jgi:hypothetical protein